MHLNDLSDLSLPMTGEQDFCINNFQGKNLILYFYPKDNTPGCTMEAHGFRDKLTKFQKYNTEIIGVSRDSVKKHDNFKSKHNLPFDLIADVDGKLCKHFDLLKEKSMFGKKFLGIERSTFLFNTNGELAKEWRKVKVIGHTQEVLDKVKELTK